MYQNSCALDVTQKAVAKAGTFTCALDKSRNICHYKCLIVVAYNAQIGGKCCKVVVGNFGFSGRYHRQKCAFANIWEAHKTNVRNSL